MSGIEAAGLVLGALPLLIVALEHYAEGANTLRMCFKYERELKDLARIVRANYLFYKDTCTTLLTYIAPPKKIAVLLQDIGGKEWEDQDLRNKLSQFLGDSYDVYKDSIESMKLVVEEFEKKLRLGPDGKVRSRSVYHLQVILTSGFSPSGTKRVHSGKLTRRSSSAYRNPTTKV